MSLTCVFLEDFKIVSPMNYILVREMAGYFNISKNFIGDICTAINIDLFVTLCLVLMLLSGLKFKSFLCLGSQCTFTSVKAIYFLNMRHVQSARYIFFCD